MKWPLMTQEEAGKILGVGRSMAYHIEVKALMKLYEGLRSDPVLQQLWEDMGGDKECEE